MRQVAALLAVRGRRPGRPARPAPGLPTRHPPPATSDSATPYRVTCESIEAIQQIAGDRLLLGCDNNVPNTGRADDNEFIVVKVAGLRGE